MNNEIILYKYQKEGFDEHSTFVRNEDGKLFRFYFDGWDGYRGNVTCRQIFQVFEFLGYKVSIININEMPEQYENEKDFIE